MKRFRSTTLSLTLAMCFGPGCRIAYEILPDESDGLIPGDGDGDTTLGGTDGDGDGDGDFPLVTGGASAGGSGSGASGGSDSGGSSAGGSVGTGGDGTGGTDTGGSSSGGNAAGGSSSGGAGSGGGGSSGDLLVNTSVDENDAGATAVDPKGTGLSFREALTIANGMAASTIEFTSGLTAQVNADLPVLIATTTIVGNGATLDFSGRISSNQCLTLDGGTVLIEELTFSACSEQPILIGGGSNHQISNCTFLNNAAALTTTQSSSGTTIGPGNYFTGGLAGSIFLGGPNDIVLDNVFQDVSSGNAISIGSTGDGALILGNLFVRTNVGVFFSNNGDNVDIWHNTFVSTVTSAVVTGMAVGIDVRNNIFTHSGQYGLNADSTDLSANDYNLFFSNGGHCSNCSAGLGANSKIQDPIYASFASGDFTLGTGSPAIDTGTDLGVDRNGATGGTFNGSAPDMGYSESN